MSEKIDYDAYLKQINLADITTKQEDKIKQYLEEQCKTDDALKAVYNPEKIKDCYNFIFECAKKVAHGNSSVIEDAVVYKMARDYFIEILPAIPETTDDQSEQKAETDNKKAETDNKKAEKKNKTEQKTEEKPVDITPAVEAVKEVSEQVEADAASDKEKHDYCGFEVFGEETDEPAEAAEEEPCNQDEVGEKESEEVEAEQTEEPCDQVNKEVEEAAEDVFFSGQAFNAGDIIDKHGRRLLFCELKVGMRFILENKLNEDFYSVGVIKKVYEDKIIYDSYKEKLTAYKRYIDDDFPCIDNEPGGWCFSVPKDALILGWQKDNGGEMYGEPRAPVIDYDTEGNGLLFGF